MTELLHCSFCRKSEREVAKLAAGPDVYICDECVAVASRIMREAEPRLPSRLWRWVRARLGGVALVHRRRAALCA